MISGKALSGCFAAVCALVHTGIARPQPASEPDTAILERIVITEARFPTEYITTAGNTASISRDEIEVTGHTHVSELMYRAPGTWIVRGSGQEHLTAIRSPVMTGAGACGAFLFMEDGIPIRTSGFCNVNQLFEINTEQSARAEVVRGPGGALYGSNALHGMINYLLPYPASGAETTLAAEIGTDDYYRARIGLGSWDGQSGVKVLANVTHDGGYRADSGFDQGKVNVLYSRRDANTEFDLAFSGTYLDQQTAGFIFGQNAYKDDTLVGINLNPEAFRKVESQRLTARWTRLLSQDVTVDIRPYVRRSRMEFLQHFLPGQPLEENGQNSIGVLTAFEKRHSDRFSTIAGIDIEYADGFLVEDQENSITDGSPFLMETRPAGKHYDYDVDALSLAPYLVLVGKPTDRITLNAGLRAEYLRYEYENGMLDGNTREDGTVCGMGGCLFNRPSNSDDSFLNVAPKLGLLYDVNQSNSIYASVRRGFRAPQVTELYRLQRQQSISDLTSEELNSFELGWRMQLTGFWLDAAAFYMAKDNFIFRDANGINVSDGKTLHKGFEFDLTAALSDSFTLYAAGTYAIHEYDFDRDVGAGDSIFSGNEIDTAPETLGSVRLDWSFHRNDIAEFEWVHVGGYYLDAANLAAYEGYDLLNLRILFDFSNAWQAYVRVNNVTNTKYAERADFAFGEYRYFPGRKRSYFLQLQYQPR